MTDNDTLNTDAARWRAELLAVKREILDCEPVKALELLDNMIADLDPARC